MRWLEHFVVLTHQVHKDLETIAIEVSELVEEMVSRCRFRHAVQIGGFKLPLHLADGLDAPGGDLVSTDGLESNTGLILIKEAD